MHFHILPEDIYRNLIKWNFFRSRYDRYITYLALNGTQSAEIRKYGIDNAFLVLADYSAGQVVEYFGEYVDQLFQSCHSQWSNNRKEL